MKKRVILVIQKNSYELGRVEDELWKGKKEVREGGKDGGRRKDRVRVQGEV